MAFALTTTRATSTSRKKAILSILVGFALTLGSVFYIAIDAMTTNRLTDHVRAAYPTWPQSDINADKIAIASYMVGFGVLAMVAWLWSAWAANKEKPWARVAITTVFIVGTSLALMNATLSGGAYDQIVPTIYGVAGLIPSIAGLVTVILLWKRDG